MDLSLQGHATSSVASSVSDYLTAPKPQSANSSLDGGVENLSSDETVSETLLRSCYTPDKQKGSQSESENSDISAGQRKSKSNQIPETGLVAASQSLPITLTSSMSGTTVCTQVETTYETKVTGEPEFADDQEGNFLLHDLASQSVASSKHGNQLSSLSGAMDYQVFKLNNNGNSVTPVRALNQSSSSTNLSNPAQLDVLTQRPVETNHNTESPNSLHLLQPHAKPTSMELEDIEEECTIISARAEVNHITSSTVSLDPDDKFGDKPLRSASRESSNSLREFEHLESALSEEVEKEDGPLSEIDEGQESQMTAESSDWTEIPSEPDSFSSK
jgi:hypothetical protein